MFNGLLVILLGLGAIAGFMLAAVAGAFLAACSLAFMAVLKIREIIRDHAR